MHEVCSERASLQPLDIVQLLSNREALDDLLTEPCVLVQYRPRWMVEGRDGFVLARPGSNIAQLVGGLAAGGHIAPEAAALGSVFLSDGGVVPRELWHRVRPKPDTVIFISIVPEGISLRSGADLRRRRRSARDIGQGVRSDLRAYAARQRPTPPARLRSGVRRPVRNAGPGRVFPHWKVNSASLTRFGSCLGASPPSLGTTAFRTKSSAWSATRTHARSSPWPMTLLT